MLVDEHFTLCVCVECPAFGHEWFLIREDGVVSFEDWLDAKDAVADLRSSWEIVEVVEPRSYLVGAVFDDHRLEAHVSVLTEEGVRELEHGLTQVEVLLEADEGGFDSDEEWEWDDVFECFLAVFEKFEPWWICSSSLARCFCYCRSCTGGLWSGVTNAAALIEEMNLIGRGW